MTVRQGIELLLDRRTSVETANHNYDIGDNGDENLNMMENVLSKRKQALEKHSKDNKVSSWLDKNIQKPSSEENENSGTQQKTFLVETATSID